MTGARLPTIAERIGAFASSLDADTVPAEAAGRARAALLDAVGVAIAGSDAPFARLAREEALAQWRDGPCTVIGSARRLVAPGAAHANAVAAHVLDFDANLNTGMVFAPAILMPALVACAEARGASGADLLAAFAAGTEVAAVLATCLSDAPYRKDRDSLYRRGWFNTAVLGPIAVAAAVSRLAGLDAAQAANAVAIAACGAGGLRIAVGSDMKPHLAARTAEAGLRAASLAAAGSEAPPDAFEGFRGFVGVVNGGVWHERLDLGAFADPGLSLKLYPACSSIQAAAEALATLLAEHGVAGGEVASVRCEVTAHIGANLTFPRPQTVTQAQFSMPFALGCILAHGRFTADLLSEAGLADPAVRDAMGLVSMEVGRLFADEAEAASYPEATRVVATLRDGTVLSRLQTASTGKPNNPMGDAALRGKFMTNAMPALGEPSAHRLADTILSIETLADVRALLAPPPAVGRAA